MKVVITGAESSGKTTLFNSLEDFYNIKGAKEYAREYLSKIDRERLVHKTLSEEISHDIHSIRLKLYTLEEYELIK